MAFVWQLSVGQTGCKPPFDLIPSQFNDSIISLNWSQWSSGDSSYYYDAELREVGIASWTPAEFPYGHDHEYCDYTKATNGKCYEWRVRTICTSPSGGKDTTSWSITVYCARSVQRPCDAPTSLNTKMNSDSTAELSWTQLLTGSGSLIYDAEYRELPLTSWTKAYFPYGNDAELAWIKNAKLGTCYEWRVRTICYSGNNSDTSAWAYKILNTGAASCPSSPPPPPTATVNPDFTFTIDPCSPRRVSFSNTTTVSGTAVKSIEWDLGDNTKATSNQPVHVYQKPGTYQVTLTIMEDGGKTYQKTSTLTVRDLTRFANAGNDLALCSRDTVSLQASGGESYSWSPCVSLSDCRIANPKIFPGTSGNYIVTVTNKDGCTDSDTVSVKFRDPAIKLYIPNAFTPNNDGINDFFRPLISLPGNVSAEWKLFNRFGNLVFSAKNNMNGWNGNYKGQPQPSGNYTYIIKLNAENNCPATQYKGTVMLIR